MGILSAIIIGLIVGALAKFIMPGRDPGGVIITILLGIGGAVVARWIGAMAGWYREGEAAGFLASIVGAILILGVYRMIAGKRITA